jgi:hypothetical protein
MKIKELMKRIRGEHHGALYVKDTETHFMVYCFEDDLNIEVHADGELFIVRARVIIHTMHKETKKRGIEFLPKRFSFGKTAEEAVEKAIKELDSMELFRDYNELLEAYPDHKLVRLLCGVDTD